MEERALTSAIPADPSLPSDVLTKLEDLDVTLDHLHQLRSRLEETEGRFRRMTEDCGIVLDGLVKLDQHHASTVAALNERLSDWCDVERKLIGESTHRLQRFELGVNQEWKNLIQQYGEPLDALRKQAVEIRETFQQALKAAELTNRLSEESFAAQAADMDRRMADWARRLYAAVLNSANAGGNGTEPRLGTGSGAVQPPTAEPWPLEGVARLHQEVRATESGYARPTNESAGPIATTGAIEPARNLSMEPRNGSGSPQMATLDAAVQAAAPRTGVFARVLWGAAVLAIAAGLAVSWAYVSQLREQVGRLQNVTQESAVRLTAAEHQANDAQLASLKELERAQNAMTRTQAIAEVLAAPDLVRFDLRGLSPAPGAYAQALWSRSRGVVVSASRLPPLSEDKTYQLWVIGEGAAAPVGFLEPDEAGRSSVMVPGPLTFPRAVALSLTLEPRSGSRAPTGAVFLRTSQ